MDVTVITSHSHLAALRREHLRRAMNSQGGSYAPTSQLESRGSGPRCPAGAMGPGAPWAGPKPPAPPAPACGEPSAGSGHPRWAPSIRVGRRAAFHPQVRLLRVPNEKRPLPQPMAHLGVKCNNPGEHPGEDPGEAPGDNPGEHPGDNPGHTGTLPSALPRPHSGASGLRPPLCFLIPHPLPFGGAQGLRPPSPSRPLEEKERCFPQR